MNPAAQLSVSLLTALLLWLPSFAATLRGDLTLPTAAGRYLLAFVLARLGIGLLARLVNGYAATAARPAPAAAAAAPVDEPVLDLADGEDVLRRRSTDAAETEGAA